MHHWWSMFTVVELQFICEVSHSKVDLGMRLLTSRNLRIAMRFIMTVHLKMFLKHDGETWNSRNV